MATILRYVKYFRPAQGVTRFLNFLPSPVEASSRRLRLDTLLVPQITKSYATRAAVKQFEFSPDSKRSFNNLEQQLNRSGRILKSDIEKVLSEIQLAGFVTSLEGLLLIRSCGRSLIHSTPKECIQLVKEIWRTLENMKVPMDISHYNALLNVYIEKNHDFSPEKFIQQMNENGIKPNRVTYQRLIAAYCQKGDISGATKILELMKQDDLPLCENVFNSLITGYSVIGDIGNSIGILKVMESSGINPSPDTYFAILCAHARRGDMAAIDETLKKIGAAEIVIQDGHLMDIVGTLAENGYSTEAEEFASKFPRKIDSDMEVARILVKLVGINQIDLALKILRLSSMGITRHQARSTFIIRQMVVDKNYTPKQIVDVCKTLEDEGLHNRATLIALYHSYTHDMDPERGLFILKACLAKGEEIREHYFWPLFRGYARNSDVDGILETLKSMNEDFKIVPSLRTLTEYVIPCMFGTYEDIISQLEPLNIPRVDILTSIANRLLYDRKLGSAASFISSYPCKYSKNLLMRQLVDAYEARSEPKSFVTILRSLTDEEDSDDETKVKIVDAALRECIAVLPKYRLNMIPGVLKELVAAGLSISPEVGEEVKAFLSNEMNDEITGLIEKLTSGNLKPIPIQEYNSFLKMKSDVVGTRGNEFQVITLRKKFAEYYETKETEKMVAVLRQLEKCHGESAAVYAQAIDVVAADGNIDTAKELIDKFLEKYPNAKLDSLKILQYAELLVKNDRFVEAIQFLTEQRIPESRVKQSRGVQKRVRDLLDASADTKHVDNTYQLFHFLKSQNYVDADQFCLSPLVRIHVLRNDLPKAVETFEQLCKEFKCTPYKNLLSLALIEAENATALQQVTDLSSEVHGENNALVDLAFTFLECGKKRQAQKILETPGIQLFNSKISKAIWKMAYVGKYELLEHLIDVTRSIVRVDRSVLFNTTLEVYDSKNDWQRGLGLWTKMQEDDVQPTKFFLTTLSNLLRRNDQPIPFVEVDDSQDSQKNQYKSANVIPVTFDIQNSRHPERSNVDEKINQAISEKDWTQAEYLCSSLSSTKGERKYNYGRLIRALIEEGEIDNAFDITKALLQRNFEIRDYTFSEVCDELIKQKRFQDIQDLDVIMNERMKNQFDYKKILSKIQIITQGVKHFIQSIDVRIPTEDVRRAEKVIHFGELTHGLIRDPTALPEFEQWAKDLAQTGITRGMHCLWNYHFINDSSEADKYWKEYILTNRSPLIRPIVDHAHETKNTLLVERLLQQLKKHPQLNINSLCRAYSGIIMVHNKVGSFDRGLEALTEFSSKYKLEMLSIRILRKLKEGVEKSGKIFPFKIDKQDFDNEQEVEEKRAASSGNM